VEIGAGAGALTIPLLRRGVEVVAVEVDPRLCRLLERRAALEVPEARLTLVAEDVLRWEPPPGREGSWILLGNLPYQITTPILEWILEHRRRFAWAGIMVQREYGLRLLAQPGDRNASALTAWVAYHARVELETRVSRGSFWPTPDVDSMVLRLTFHRSPEGDPRERGWLESTLSAVFAHRRKQLLAGLVAALGWDRADVERLLREVGLDPRRRGESLTLEEHLRLARLLGPALRDRA
jgi:16S rRNA (adenine1518-N6/adenine1519-N6)-dimethyltransferase